MDRKERIAGRIKELESSAKDCNYKSIRQAYLLGEEDTTEEDVKKIGKLIAEFELFCKCSPMTMIKQIEGHPCKHISKTNI